MMDLQPSITIHEDGRTHHIRIVQGRFEMRTYIPERIIGITSAPLSTDTARELAALFEGYVRLQEMAGVVG